MVDKMTEEFNLMKNYKVQKKKFQIIGFCALLAPIISGAVIINTEGKPATTPFIFGIVGGTISISSDLIIFIYKIKLYNKQRDIVNLYNAH
jgi:hypothetical protein